MKITPNSPVAACFSPAVRSLLYPRDVCGPLIHKDDFAPSLSSATVGTEGTLAFYIFLQAAELCCLRRHYGVLLCICAVYNCGGSDVFSKAVPEPRDALQSH